MDSVMYQDVASSAKRGVRSPMMPPTTPTLPDEASFVDFPVYDLMRCKAVEEFRLSVVKRIRASGGDTDAMEAAERVVLSTPFAPSGKGASLALFNALEGNTGIMANVARQEVLGGVVDAAATVRAEMLEVRRDVARMQEFIASTVQATAKAVQRFTPVAPQPAPPTPSEKKGGGGRSPALAPAFGGKGVDPAASMRAAAVQTDALPECSTADAAVCADVPPPPCGCRAAMVPLLQLLENINGAELPGARSEAATVADMVTSVRLWIERNIVVLLQELQLASAAMVKLPDGTTTSPQKDRRAGGGGSAYAPHTTPPLSTPENKPLPTLATASIELDADVVVQPYRVPRYKRSGAPQVSPGRNSHASTNAPNKRGMPVSAGSVELPRLQPQHSTAFSDWVASKTHVRSMGGSFGRVSPQDHGTRERVSVFSYGSTEPPLVSEFQRSPARR